MAADTEEFFEYTPGVLHASMAFSMADTLGLTGPPAHYIAVFSQRSRQPLEAPEYQHKSHPGAIIGNLQQLDQFTEQINDPDQAWVATRGKHEVSQQANADERVALDPNLAREKDDHAGKSFWDEGKSRALIIGGQFPRHFSTPELRKRFHVTVIDAKWLFEYTPLVLRANAKPAHLDTPLERSQLSEHLSARELKKRSHETSAYVKDFWDERLGEDVPSRIVQFRDSSLREPD